MSAAGGWDGGAGGKAALVATSGMGGESVSGFLVPGRISSWASIMRGSVHFVVVNVPVDSSAACSPTEPAKPIQKPRPSVRRVMTPLRGGVLFMWRDNSSR